MEFITKVSQEYTDSWNFSFEHGEMSNSQKEAVIPLIDWCEIINWPPISLLNVDCKIASKAFTLNVKSKFNIPLGISALWWLAESSTIDAYVFLVFETFQVQTIWKSSNFLSLYYLA